MLGNELYRDQLLLFVLVQALADTPDAQRHLLTSLGPGFTGAFAVLEAG